MADTALDNAVARRDELATRINTAQQQIEDWRKELRRTELFIADWYAFAGYEGAPVLVEGVVVNGHSTEPPGNPKLKNAKKEAVAEAARRMIEDAGYPLTRAELWRRLTEERGFQIQGTDPEMVLSTMLWRMRTKSRIVNLKNDGYWLADRPWPKSGYDPTINIDELFPPANAEPTEEDDLEPGESSGVLD